MPEAETLRVAGGSSQVFALGKGDRLRLLDVEGGQNALLYTFSAQDHLPASHPAAPRDALPGLIAANENAAATHHQLAGHDLASASGILVSGPQAQAGEALRLSAPADMTCVLIVPSAPSSADAVEPATDFTLEIARAEVNPAVQPRDAGLVGGLTERRPGQGGRLRGHILLELLRTCGNRRR